MKTLKGLDSKLTNILTNAGGAEPPTYKELILNSVGAIRGLEPAKVVRLGKLGTLVMVMKSEQELEDADFELLREVVEKAKIYPDFWVGLTVDKFKVAELDAENKERKK